MSRTSARCKPIVTASSASNCCKRLVSQTMILPRCPHQKRNRNGNHLRPQIKIGPTKSESSPSERRHQLLSQRLAPYTSSVRGKAVSAEGPPSLTRTPSASTKLLRARVQLLRPISWPVGRKHPLILSPKRLASLTENPRAPCVTLPNLHRGHLQPSCEKIPVKSIATRAGKKGITLEIALATPRENPFCPRTNHFDRS